MPFDLSGTFNVLEQNPFDSRNRIVDLDTFDPTYLFEGLITYQTGISSSDNKPPGLYVYKSATGWEAAQADVDTSSIDSNIGILTSDVAEINTTIGGYGDIVGYNINHNENVNNGSYLIPTSHRLKNYVEEKTTNLVDTADSRLSDARNWNGILDGATTASDARSAIGAVDTSDSRLSDGRKWNGTLESGITADNALDTLGLKNTSSTHATDVTVKNFTVKDSDQTATGVFAFQSTKAIPVSCQVTEQGTPNTNRCDLTFTHGTRSGYNVGKLEIAATTTATNHENRECILYGDGHAEFYSQRLGYALTGSQAQRTPLYAATYTDDSARRYGVWLNMENERFVRSGNSSSQYDVLWHNPGIFFREDMNTSGVPISDKYKGCWLLNCTVNNDDGGKFGGRMPGDRSSRYINTTGTQWTTNHGWWQFNAVNSKLTFRGDCLWETQPDNAASGNQIPQMKWSYQSRGQLNSQCALQITRGNAWRFDADSNGTTRAEVFTATSDDRMKHNEEPIVDALTAIDKLRPLKYIKTVDICKPGYTMDDDGTEHYELYDADHFFGGPGASIEDGMQDPDLPEAARVDSGVIAQDVYAIPELSHLVDPPKDVNDLGDRYTLHYDGIHAYTIKAVQELHALVKTLEARIATLEAN